jgi:hypothetical protein
MEKGGRAGNWWKAGVRAERRRSHVKGDTLKGQWTGRTEGDIKGQIIVNIDGLGRIYGDG